MPIYCAFYVEKTIGPSERKRNDSEETVLHLHQVMAEDAQNIYLTFFCLTG